MKNNEIQTIRSVSSANIGWSWPVVLVKALTGKTPEAFPDFDFHRGGSKENTIAFGKDHCEFVFEKRAA